MNMNMCSEAIAHPVPAHQPGPHFHTNITLALSNYFRSFLVVVAAAAVTSSLHIKLGFPAAWLAWPG